MAATLADLESDIETALSAAFWADQNAVTRLEQRLTRGGLGVSYVLIVRSTDVVTTSNQVKIMAEVLVSFAVRAASGTLSHIGDAERTINNVAMRTFTVNTFWSGLDAVSVSPMPEVEIESEPERIGEVITFTLRVRVALEA